MRRGETDTEFGGYFIIHGQERVLRLQVRPVIHTDAGSYSAWDQEAVTGAVEQGEQ